MGTQLQASRYRKRRFWQYENKDLEGCNELLNLTAPHILETIYENTHCWCKFY
jgi:5-methyltetrahydrofolate--homocysteine methyltransferase